MANRRDLCKQLLQHTNFLAPLHESQHSHSHAEAGCLGKPSHRNPKLVVKQPGPKPPH